MKTTQITHSFIQVNGIQLHVAMAGPLQGQPVILLHGFPESWHCWGHQIKALAEAGFRVIAPDQRGYNLSERPNRIKDYRIDLLTQDIDRLIEALEYKKVVLIGHDWGGVVAHQFAMDYPERLKKLIILNAPHPKAFQQELIKPRQFFKSWYAFFFQIPFLPELIIKNTLPLFVPFAFRYGAFNKKAYSDEDLKRMTQALGEPNAIRSMLHWYRAGLLYPPKKGSRKIKTDTMVIWGEKDVALNIHLLDNLQKYFEGKLRIEKISESAHWVQNEAAPRVNQLILEYLQ